MRITELMLAKQSIFNRYYKARINQNKKDMDLIISDAKDLIIQINISTSTMLNTKTSLKNQLKEIIFPK